MGAHLIVVYDVDGLTEAEIDCLAGEAVVQGETSDASEFFAGHPGVPARTDMLSSLEARLTRLADDEFDEAEAADSDGLDQARRQGILDALDAVRAFVRGEAAE